MSEMQSFLVPDYYPAFSCKMGACRHPCCEGWPVSISMKDYFTLLSVECSPELRRRLDAGLHLALHPQPEAYAQITPRYDGQCPLHLPDGRCALQAELGEKALAAVCRLYPRGVRQGNGMLECSCAASCEAVPEMLLHRQEPLTFITKVLNLTPPALPPRQHTFCTADHEGDLRRWFIALMQNRHYPLPQRLIRLGQAMRAADEAIAQEDDQWLAQLLENQHTLPPLPESIDSPALIACGLKAARQLLELLDRRSNSIRTYGEAVLALIGTDEGSAQRYQAAQANFARLIPQWETWFEHLLVNHMFFAQFPFQDRPVPLKDEFLALCAVYVLMRLLAVGWMWEHTGEDAAADVMAAVFRLVEHTEFDCLAAPLLQELTGGDSSQLLPLLNL